MAGKQKGKTGQGPGRWRGVLLVLGGMGLIGALGVVGLRGGVPTQAVTASTPPAAKPPPPPPPTPYERLPAVLARIGQKEIKKDILLATVGGVEGGDPKQEQLAVELAWMTAKGRVQHEVLYREAQRRGIEMAPEDRAAVEFMEKRQHQAQDVVSQVGIDAADAIRQYRETMFVKRLLEKEFYDKVEVTPAELQAAYERSPEAWWLGETFRVRRIVVSTHPDKGREHLENAQRRAMALYERATKKNADFAALARAESEEPLRAKGGLLGEFDLQNSPIHDSRIIQAFRSLEPGQVSLPVHTEEGYQIFFMEKKTPVRRMSLQEATPLVRKEVQYEKGAPAAMQWAEELERAAGAEVLIPKPASLDAPPVNLPPGVP